MDDMRLDPTSNKPARQPEAVAATVLSEILRNVATRLASYKVPEGLRILDEMPRNALSKVDCNMLQAMAVSTDKAGKSELRLAAETTRRAAETLRKRPLDQRLPSLLRL
jgi:long-chain acyl-CoA synthetase